jgi:uncharacterized protein YndB with AHSA1/START domain/DNA-binding transcriptional ArsR family regulator
VVVVDAVFKALADPTRRDLLDALFDRDGQTLGELERRSTLTRFGVMKHLKVLEGAGLVATRRRGREKLHFLNPVPIRLVHDRWVSKYAEPWAAGLSGLKQRIEEEPTMDTQTEIDTQGAGKRPWTASPTDKVFEIYIKTTPERLWEAITDDAQRRTYSFGVGVRSDWRPGSRIETFHPGAGVAIGDGEILEVDPPRLLVHTFVALWSDEVKAEGTSRVTWEIEPVGDSCRLTLTHDRLRENANGEIYGGWPMILSGLKTLLETGETLTTPGSQRYAQAT